MVLVCLPTHTRNPAIRFTPLHCEHCTHPTSILLPNGQLSVFTVCEPVLSSSVRALPKATVRAGMVLTGAEYCYRAFSQCLFTVQEWGLLLKSGRRSGFATGWERGGEGDGYGRRIAQRQCRWMGVGHLDTFHLPGYAVGPFLVTKFDLT